MRQADPNKTEPPLESNRTPLFLNGKRFLHRRDYPSALRCFEADLEALEENGTLDYRIDLLINLGNSYAQLGMPERSQKYYREVLSLQQEKSDPHAVGLTLVNLGNLAREAGNRTRAEAYYLEAEDTLEKVEDTHSLAVLYSNFGLLAQDKGAIDEGISYLNKAIDLHKKTGFEEGLATTWGQLGRLFTMNGNDRDAEICFNYAATHFGSLGDPYGETEALRGLAHIYELRHEPELVLRCRNRIIEIHRRFGLPSPNPDPP
jgi:tetratricopeptide (TPR) repeat protein